MSTKPTIRRPMNAVRRPGASTAIRRPGASTGTAAGSSRGPGTAPGSRGNDEGYLYTAGVRDLSKRVTEYRTDADVCPVCQTDRQFNKNLRLLVSPCYHKMCESCIDRLFTLGPEPCPTCGKVLRKVNFAHQTFEDLRVEKEISVRRRMAEIYNKTRDDFASLKEYNQYLEDVEDMTFNLLNDIDISTTEAKLQAYQNENATLIATNQHKAAMESLSQSERDEVEKRARAERVRMIEEAQRVDRAEDERVKAQVVEALTRAGDSGKAAAQEIQERAAKAKMARAAALSAAVPPSLAALYRAADVDETPHSPNSPSYAGPYVPIPYDDPDAADWAGWYTLKDDYSDGRAGVVWAKEDRENRVRGGGWDLKLFWEMEVRSALEALSLEPLR